MDKLLELPNCADDIDSKVRTPSDVELLLDFVLCVRSFNQLVCPCHNPAQSSYSETVAWKVVAFQMQTGTPEGWWTSCRRRTSCQGLYLLMMSRKNRAKSAWVALVLFIKVNTKARRSRWKCCTRLVIRKAVLMKKSVLIIFTLPMLIHLQRIHSEKISVEKHLHGGHSYMTLSFLSPEYMKWMQSSIWYPHIWRTEH